MVQAGGAGQWAIDTEPSDDFFTPSRKGASIFTANDCDGNKHHVLAIVTTLELDPESHNYKRPFVEKLSKAARKYLAESGKATAFVLMNRPSDWHAPRTPKGEKGLPT
jgi:hypothetical protein